MIEWTEQKPAKVGLYLFRNDREWVHRLVVVTQGDWKLAQNPAWLYAGDKPVNGTERGWWYGPIPESPKAK